MAFRKDPNYYGYVRFKIRNIHVSAVGILDTKKTMISELKDFDIHENELIIDTSNDGLRVHLSGDLCWFGKCLFAEITEGVFWVVNKLAKNAILRKVEGSVKDMVKEKFVGISFMDIIG